MSDARAELVDEIAGRPIGSGYYSTSVGIDEAREIADAILAAGYSKPRTISTVEELDALPVESIVRDVDGLPKEKQNATGGEVFWAAPGHSKHYGTGSIWLPATVLYESLP